MSRRYWVFLILIAVFVVALVLVARSGNSSEGNTLELALPTGTPTKISEPSLDAPTDDPKPEAAEALRSSDITGAQYFTECAFRTGANAVIGVPAAIAQEGGLSLEPGDEIAVFAPDGEVCVGAAVWTGSNIAVTVWGDDPQSERVDGLQEGQEMVFRIWDKSETEEISIKDVKYTLGEGVYSVDGIYVVEALTFE